MALRSSITKFVTERKGELANKMRKMRGARTFEAERVLLCERRKDVTHFDRGERVLARLAAFGLAAGALYAVTERLALDTSEYAVHASEGRLYDD